MMKKIVLSLFFLSLFGSLVIGQDVDIEDIVIMTPEAEEYQKKIDEELARMRNSRANFDNPLAIIPVQFHFGRRDDGTGGLAANEAARLLEELNSSFAPANMQFFEVNPVNEYNSSEFFDFDSRQEAALTAANNVNGAINIYIIGGRLSSGTSSLCGYAYFPPSADHLFVATGCAGPSNSTLVHEVGHYFSLFHTHGKTNTGTTDEFVNGSNCTTGGDNVCDTPADPNLSGLVSNCAYGGQLRDANGDLYMPMVSNFMSYAPGSCRNAFTFGQLERARVAFDINRQNLDWRSDQFIARISADVTNGCAPLTVSFQDETLAGATREWTFEGGDIDRSAGETPLVTYDTPGRYAVKLLARSNSGEVSEVVFEDYIIVEDVLERVTDKYTEPFDAGDVPENWVVNNINQSLSFEYSDVNSNDDGSGSIVIRNFDYDVEIRPTVDELSYPSISTREMKSVDFTFDLAYTYRFEEVDTLEVGYTLDCFAEEVILLKSAGDQINTAEPSSQYFTPTTDQWSARSFTVDISSLSGVEDLEVINFYFRALGNNGNNLYLDNVNIVPDYSLERPDFLRVRDNGDNFVNITWADFSTNEIGFSIERSVDGTNFEEVGTVGRNIKDYIDNALPDVEEVFYRVRAINSQAQSAYTDVLNVPLVVTSIEDEPQLDFLTVYPNPTSDVISIAGDHPNGDVCVDIVSLDGQIIGSAKKIIGETLTIDMSSIPSGIILVRMIYDGIVDTRKLIIK